MTNTKTKAVYRIDIAAQLKMLGHEIVGILPNPQKPEFNMWIFKVDETFYEDLNNLIGR